MTASLRRRSVPVLEPETPLYECKFRSAHLFLGWISDTGDHPVELIPHGLGSDSSGRRLEVLHGQ